MNSNHLWIFGALVAGVSLPLSRIMTWSPPLEIEAPPPVVQSPPPEPPRPAEEIPAPQPKQRTPAELDAIVRAARDPAVYRNPQARRLVIEELRPHSSDEIDKVIDELRSFESEAGRAIIDRDSK